MKKGLAILFSSLFIFNANATPSPVAYCDGTETPNPSKNLALQYVVQEFAREFGCKIGNHCLSNYNTYNYAIGWEGTCVGRYDSAFVCQNGWCHPLGFVKPAAPYYEPK
jgi:hypothetical protein